MIVLYGKSGGHGYARGKATAKGKEIAGGKGAAGDHARIIAPDGEKPFAFGHIIQKTD